MQIAMAAIAGNHTRYDGHYARLLSHRGSMWSVFDRDISAVWNGQHGSRPRFPDVGARQDVHETFPPHARWLGGEASSPSRPPRLAGAATGAARRRGDNERAGTSAGGDDA